ncbi:MAG: Rsd/AlgQ family anti-sigma factor [Gammaproteobacteria bacterium]|nr:Rsd/AlgQ family anti-sigma factor [Gammaproteobacteria bacterium]
MSKGRKQGDGERRARGGSIVKKMLKERSELLSLLMELSQADPRHAARTDPDVLLEFCQVLVDYVAAGHFGLYERIISGQERRRNVAQFAADLLPRLEQTTEVAMAFNEKYAPDSGDPDLTRLLEDLSELGEELTTRFELEDRLFGLFLEPAGGAH